MKKKPLLFALLALAIVTSLTAGTLAVYTKTTTLDTAEITVKKFAFSSAGGVAGGTNDVNLAPGETMVYNFSVSNFEGTDGAPSEVKLDYSIGIDLEAVSNKMPGLVTTITQKVGNETITLKDASTDKKFTLEASADMNVRKTIDYVVTLYWGDPADDTTNADGLNKHSVAGKSNILKAGALTVTVTATQGS